jgi:hypothetical protein
VKLPYLENAVVPEAKITKYLLNLGSENGKAKARFFLAFGFTIEAWEVMAEALRQHAVDHEVTKVETRPPFGIHYVIEGAINTPDERNPDVRVVWIIDDGDEIPRLVSAYPLSGG